MERGDLYHDLVRYVNRKFASRPNITEISEDIVLDVFTDFYAKNGFSSDKENFGYLSAACIHQAYKRFKAWDIHNLNVSPLDACLNFLSDTDIVQEIMQAEDTKQILSSLETLKTIEKAIILKRYYGCLKFTEIAEELGMNINTILSHHRRSLEKLRPKLSKHFY